MATKKQVDHRKTAEIVKEDVLVLKDMVINW